MRIMIFDWTLNGHHLEYLHHCYDGAISKKDCQFFFLVPKSFDDVKSKLVWKDSENVHFLYLTNEEESQCIHSNLLISAWYKSKIVKKYIKKYAIDKLWLIMLMLTVPFIIFRMPRRVKVSGILYRIYLYDKSITGIRKVVEKLRYKLIVSSSIIDNVWVLNDEFAQKFFNEYFCVNKFKYLPDPVPSIDRNELRDLREQLNIPIGNKVFLQFGGLNKRKGTLEILKAAELLGERESKKYTFVFAGVIYDDIKKEFYEYLEVLKDVCQILVFDEFCSYTFINNLCYTCDCILVPYKNISQSSGVIGYAGFFRKPVIGPKEGLLGQLIASFNLGFTLENTSPIAIRNALKNNLSLIEDEYCKKHTVEMFKNVIFSDLTDE